MTYVQDKSFDRSSVQVNSGLEIDKNYVNFILFGGDSRSGDLGAYAHGDSMVLVSVNKKSGEVKMVSVYRDTYLKYIKDGEEFYDKATNALYLAGIPSAINMLNEHLDLNMTDYIIVNFAGLANVVDALGGLELTITEDERFYINGYLTETREVTGMDAPDVETSGTVKLTGLQATAYCRIRAVAFYQEDGTTISTDFGRTARQRLVLELILNKAKSAGVSELLDVSKVMFSKNVDEDKFISSSFPFNDVLELLPVALEASISGSEGFPFDYQPKRIDGEDCLVPSDLEANVAKLHEYLFGDTNYIATDQVMEISDKLVKSTGVKLDTN